MSDQQVTRDSLMMLSMTEFSPSYEYSENLEDAGHSPNRQGFAKRTIEQPECGGFTIDEKNTETLTSERDLPTKSEGNLQSGGMPVSLQEKHCFFAMALQSPEDNSLQNLKHIISQAKRAEGFFMTHDENQEEMGDHIQDKNLEERYSDDDRGYTRIPSRIRKTSHQGVEIDFTEQSMEKENQYHSEQERLSPVNSNEGMTHSKSSYLSGTVRYSKMPEEEAASIFEQRRKELLGSLLKKGKRKNLRIFQEMDSNAVRGFGSPDSHNGCDKPSVTGFVIFNDKKQNQARGRNVESPTPKKKSEVKRNFLRSSATSNRKSKSKAGSFFQNTTNKKEKNVSTSSSKVNTFRTKPAEQRSEVIKKAPSLLKENAKEVKSVKKDESSNKVYVDWKTLKYGLNKEKVGAKEKGLYEEVQEEKRSLFTGSITTTQESEMHQNLGDRDMTSKQSLIKRNDGIWADIEDLDHQIQQLEEKKSSHDNMNDENIYEQWQNSQEAFFRKNQDDLEEGMGKVSGIGERIYIRNESSLEGMTSDRYKLDSESLIADSETENVYRRYPCEKEKCESTRIYRRKSPAVQEDLQRNGYARRYRDLQEKRLSSRCEQLYKIGVEQQETRRMQSEARKKERETVELSECTFSPKIRARSTEFIEDFETRSRYWQMQKEQKLLEKEKIFETRQLAECTFFPNKGIRKYDRTSFDPNEFYQRNIEWKNKLETESTKKQDELLKQMAIPLEKTLQSPPQRFSRTPYSSAYFSQNIPMDHFNDFAPLSNRNHSKKRHQSVQKSKTPGKLQTITLARESLFSKLKPSGEKKLHLNTIDGHHVKRYNQTKARPANFEATDLMEILKKVTTSKSDKSVDLKSRTGSQSPNKFKKMTKLNANYVKGGHMQSAIQTNPVGFTLGNRKSRNGSNDCPQLLSSEYNFDNLKDNTENIVIKNNKYYITRKLNQPSISKASQLETHASDRKEFFSSIPSAQSPKQDSQTAEMTPPVSHCIYNPIRIDQENNTFKRKPLNKAQPNYSTSTDLFGDYLFGQSVEERVPLASRHLNRDDEQTKSSIDSVQKSTPKETNGNLEKKFLGLITISQGDKMLNTVVDHLKVGSNSPLNDSNLPKKRRTNFSLY